MKKVLLVLLVTMLAFTFSTNAQTFINQELEGNIDLQENTLSLKVKEISFSGTLVPIKYDYSRYYVIEGDKYQLLISFQNIKSKKETKISKMVILEGDYNKLIKDINKRKLSDENIFFEYVDYLNASKNKDIDTSWENKEYLEEKIKLKEEYYNVSGLSDYEGTYDVVIMRHSGLDYSKVNEKGKMYLTDGGFSFICEIPSIMELRGTHFIDKIFLPTRKGSFLVGRHSRKLISISINEEKTAGSFSYMEYGKAQTTSFIIKNFIN
jgi:hypothetical protein